MYDCDIVLFFVPVFFRAQTLAEVGNQAGIPFFTKP